MRPIDNIIEVKVRGNHLDKDNRNAGVQYEANARKLRIEFDESWDGFAKTVTFWDALMCNPVGIELTTNYLEDDTNGHIFIVPIPAQAMKEAGEMTFIVDGYTPDGVRQRSVADTMFVTEAPEAINPSEPEKPQPNVWEDMQTSLESIMENIEEAAKAANAVKEAQEAQQAAENAYSNAEECANNAADDAAYARGQAESAATSAGEAAGYAREALGYKNDANNFADDASSAAGEADSHRIDAEAAKAAAEEAKRLAEQAYTNAKGEYEKANSEYLKAKEEAGKAAASATAAKSSADTAAEDAAAKAVENVEDRLAGYVTQASGEAVKASASAQTASDKAAAAARSASGAESSAAAAAQSATRAASAASGLEDTAADLEDHLGEVADAEAAKIKAAADAVNEAVAEAAIYKDEAWMAAERANEAADRAETAGGVSKSYVDEELRKKLDKTGGTLDGGLNVNNADVNVSNGSIGASSLFGDSTSVNAGNIKIETGEGSVTLSTDGITFKDALGNEKKIGGIEHVIEPDPNAVTFAEMEEYVLEAIPDAPDAMPADGGTMESEDGLATMTINAYGAEIEDADIRQQAKLDISGLHFTVSGEDGKKSGGGRITGLMEATADHQAVPYGQMKRELDEVKTSVGEGKALIASAVTDKGVETADDASFAEMAENIEKIVTDAPIPDGYHDTSGVTATADKVLQDNSFVDAEGKTVWGTMTDHGEGINSETLTPDNDFYVVPEGYHHSWATEVQAPSVSKTVTPTKEEQLIKGDGYYDDTNVFLSSVRVHAIPAKYQDVSEVDVPATMVAEGYKFVDKGGAVVNGTMPKNNAADTYIDTKKTYYNIPAGYHDGNGRVLVSTETKEITPTKSALFVKPTDGKVLKEVTVYPIPHPYYDVSGVTVMAEHVPDGLYFVDSNGNRVEGTVPWGGMIYKTMSMDGLTATSVVVPAGYYQFDCTISLTDDIEERLKKI